MSNGGGNKGRYKNHWVPNSSAVKQKKIQSKDHTISSGVGGHNAHRVLDFVMRMICMTLLGRYDNAHARPSLFTVKEIYRFLQFDYPSVDDVCTWLESSMPEDTNIDDKRSATDNKPRGSSARRFFIVYVIREFHMYSVNQMPGFVETFGSLYKLREMEINISEACDAIRVATNTHIRDMYNHMNTCNKSTDFCVDDGAPCNCDHYVLWTKVKATFDPKLVELYENWPILFAVDMAIQKRPGASKDAVETVRSKKVVDSTHICQMHKGFLDLCWRPAMHYFPICAVNGVKKINSDMANVNEVIKKFRPTPTKRGLMDDPILEILSADAVEHHNAMRTIYTNKLEPIIRRASKCFVSRFVPGSDVGIEWLMFYGVDIRSVMLMREAQQCIESEEKRSAVKKLLEILAYYGMDFFILGTFYDVLVRHNGFRLVHMDKDTLCMQVESLQKKMGNEIVEIGKPLPRNISEFYVCRVHEKLNAAIVGTEHGKDGMKNTKSHGHNGVSIDVSLSADGGVYCTTSGRRVEKRDKNDLFWQCMQQPNVKVDMLGSVLRIHDTAYVMCPHCCNPMEFRWERFCVGSLGMWCGQCDEGRRKMILSRGLIWKNAPYKSVSPCAMTNMIGGIPIGARSCPYCMHCRDSPEVMEYTLIWDDMRMDGVHRLTYYPICRQHMRVYQGENWGLMSLRRLTYIITNPIRSIIVGFRRPDNPFLIDTDKDDESESDFRTRLGTRGYVPERIFLYTGNREEFGDKAYKTRARKRKDALELSSGISANGVLIKKPATRVEMKRTMMRKMKKKKERQKRRRRTQESTSSNGKRLSSNKRQRKT